MPATADKVIDFILANAPSERRVITKNPFCGTRFCYETVDEAINRLHDKGILPELEAYDIPNTTGIWNLAEGFANHELARNATKAFLGKLQQHQPKKTLEQIIPEISRMTFCTTPINRFGTKLQGMLLRMYSSSPYDALMDLFNDDEEYVQFRDLQPYDMRNAPKNTWVKEDGTWNFELARHATKQFLSALRRLHLDNTLEQIITGITARDFFRIPINRYRTILRGMLGRVYADSPYKALMDLFHNDKEFAKFRDFQPYDMKCAPQETWVKSNGTKNYVLARKQTKKLLETLSAEQPKKTMEQLLVEITKKTFDKTPINRYGTTLGGMLSLVYACSPYKALKDLINNDARLKRFRDFQPYDMQRSPMHTWINSNGTKDYALARKTTKLLLRKIQKLHDCTLQEAIPFVTRDVFRHTSINRYQTTLAGMLMNVYGDSPYRALNDLATHNS